MHVYNICIIVRLGYCESAVFRPRAAVSQHSKDDTQGQRFLTVANSRYSNLTVLECSNC